MVAIEECERVLSLVVGQFENEAGLPVGAVRL